MEIGKIMLRQLVYLKGLVMTVHGLSAASLADSTERVYKLGGNRYMEFYRKMGLKALPVSLFAAYLYLEGLVAGSVKRYLSATRHLQIVAGLGDPKMGAMPQLEYVLKGLKKKVAAQSTMTIMMKALKEVYSAANRADATMLWEALTMSF